ncbi:hypothetical protein F5879DRAFT_543975 [Lentinula edodes]|uniref:uncharacterized protein n=1 Tax=Lentinula edodes TaxID=5353 RepID=UPI001E8E9B6C|nr:uncharacterized protein C8R40DRAFT_1103130 [Lentinula edodes]KAH7875717.1 hypothetical protein C8R40DRAFT_1103130 [Lentinula edodes]KAJ3899047.1 hypothetical protein F5879DRAFT_543975 [Lentinula edodes]
MSPVESLNNTMGAAYIGVSVAGFLLGLSCLQAYIYFSEQNDTRTIRSLVGLVVLFDFVHQALISHTVYYYLILNYANPSALSLAVWSLLAEVLFNGFTAFCVQSFLTWRIWRLSNSNIWVTGIVVSLVLAEFGCVVAFGIIALVRVSTFVELAADLKELSITVNALAAAGDVLIAGILTILLQKSKTGFQRSDTMLNKLTMFAVNTGALTSLCAVASLISILAAPNTFIYISFFFCMGRLYTNSLLATLNARNKIRNAGDNVQTTSGQNFSFSFKSFTKPSSFVSYSSKKPPGEISIQIDTTRERRAQDYSSRHTLSKQEEEYELGNSSTGNLSHGDIESTASIHTLANDTHFDAV